jgi:hypothetical protein
LPQLGAVAWDDPGWGRPPRRCNTSAAAGSNDPAADASLMTPHRVNIDFRYRSDVFVSRSPPIKRRHVAARLAPPPGVGMVEEDADE